MYIIFWNFYISAFDLFDSAICFNEFGAQTFSLFSGHCKQVSSPLQRFSETNAQKVA
jgi:hypothetical protein